MPPEASLTKSGTGVGVLNGRERVKGTLTPGHMPLRSSLVFQGWGVWDLCMDRLDEAEQ